MTSTGRQAGFLQQIAQDLLEASLHSIFIFSTSAVTKISSSFIFFKDGCEYLDAREIRPAQAVRATRSNLSLQRNASQDLIPSASRLIAAAVRSRVLIVLAGFESTVSGCMYVCVFMALIITLVLCARSQDLVMSVSGDRVHVVLSIAGFGGGGKLCCKTRETAPLRRGIRKNSRTLPDSNPSHWCASSGLLPIELPERPNSRWPTCQTNVRHVMVVRSQMQDSAPLQ